MKIDIRIPQAFPQLTVKEVLEDYFLIPRKIRHFLRTKKHIRVNGEECVGIFEKIGYYQENGKVKTKTNFFLLQS